MNRRSILALGCLALLNLAGLLSAQFIGRPAISTSRKSSGNLTGADAVGGPEGTTIFSDNFNRADSGTLGGSWTDTDTVPKMGITNNAMVISHSSATTAYGTASTGDTTATKYVSFSFQLSSVTFTTAFSQDIICRGSGTQDAWKFGINTKAAGAYDTVQLSSFNDAFGETPSTFTPTLNASTVYTVKIQYTPSTAPGANNGIVRLWWNGNTGAPDLEQTNVDSDIVGQMSGWDFGAKEWNTTGTMVETLDDFRVYKIP
jgi:hypothetical protein